MRSLNDFSISIFSGEHYRWPIHHEVIERGGRFTSHLPIAIPQHKRHDVGILMHIANNFLEVSGGFKFDIDSGTIRFVTAIDVAGGDLTVCQLFALYDQHRIVDYWLDQILRMVLNSSPKPLNHATCRAHQPFDQRRSASLSELLQDVNVDWD